MNKTPIALLFIFVTYLLIVKANSFQTEAEPKSEENTVEYVIQIGDVYLEMTTEIIEELAATESMSEQLDILYENFESQLDRSDTYLGTDTLNAGIRDDIGAFIDAMQVEEPVRNAIKQNARHAQAVLATDFSLEDTRDVGEEILNDYTKVLSCFMFLEVDIANVYNFNENLKSLTYNTKSRTLRSYEFSKRLSGGVYGLYPDEEQYCE
ncbi:chromosome partitioning protein ParA [Vibrio sp. RC27]